MNDGVTVRVVCFDFSTKIVHCQLLQESSVENATVHQRNCISKSCSVCEMSWNRKWNPAGKNSTFSPFTKCQNIMFGNRLFMKTQNLLLWSLIDKVNFILFSYTYSTMSFAQKSELFFSWKMWTGHSAGIF
jgi:hypothetical protein